MRNPADRSWVAHAIQIIEADFNRSSDTHLLRVPLPGVRGVALYLKDESTHPSGSLKHRLARSLFLYALCNGWIGPQTTIVEASSGSTAVSEAYFARLLDLRFIAVMPRATSAEKIAQITFHGGETHFVDSASAMYAESARLAAELGGHYMDQFTYAERATDWRGNNNIAESIFSQMAREECPVPSWIVIGAGTGGTSATLGRYIRYRQLATRLCLADPEASVFHRHLADQSVTRLRRAAGPDRRHWASAVRALVHPDTDRSRLCGAGCGKHRRRTCVVTPHRPVVRRLDRHQSMGSSADHCRDGSARRAGLGCEPAMRLGTALSKHAPQR
jgi:cysteine synthase A